MRALVLASVLVASAAHADPFGGISGNAWLHYELSALHDVEPGDVAPKLSELVLAGARLHGIIGTRRVGYHVGIDLAAGSTLRAAGLAYDVALFPLGIALRFGDTSFAALGIGFGAMGAVGTLDDAATIPIDLTMELGGGRVRLVTRARATFVGGAAGRTGGAPNAPFGDEVEGMVGLRLGHHYEDFGAPTGNGYFVGASYREMLGARFAGIVIGYSIDMATPRPHDHHEACPYCD